VVNFRSAIKGKYKLVESMLNKTKVFIFVVKLFLFQPFDLSGFQNHTSKKRVFLHVRDTWTSGQIRGLLKLRELEEELPCLSRACLSPARMIWRVT